MKKVAVFGFILMLTIPILSCELTWDTPVWVGQLDGVNYNFNGILGVDFVNPIEGWALCMHPTQGFLIYHSVDGGNNWERQEYGMPSFMTLDIGFANTLRGWTSGIGLFKDLLGFGGAGATVTIDGGNTWEGKIKQPFISTFESLYALDSQNVWLAGMWLGRAEDAEINGVARSRTGGLTWELIDWELPMMPKKVCFVDEMTGWGAGGTWPETDEPAQDGLYDTWEVTKGLSLPLAPEFNPRNFIEQDRPSGYYGMIAKTTDGGDTWEQQYERDDCYFIGLNFTDADNGWAVCDGASGSIILHSSDGGENWEQQFRTPIDPDTMYELASLKMLNAEVGWAGGASSGFLNPHSYIVKTVDGGENWVEEENPGSVLIYDMDFLDESRGWAAGPNNMTGEILKYDLLGNQILRWIWDHLTPDEESEA